MLTCKARATEVAGIGSLARVRSHVVVQVLLDGERLVTLRALEPAHLQVNERYVPIPRRLLREFTPTLVTPEQKKKNAKRFHF